MKINNMFVKDINRSIQGVVKVGQDADEIIKTELSEYVVTKELQEHFKNFFVAYQKGTKESTDKMGVWISGFFGSGKSHFLKIISYLLGDNLYDGNKAMSFFEDKIADGFVMADMQIASDTNADIILFNIDAEADVSQAVGKDPIVKVFMKMFNKMQGFCTSMPWLADLERQMVERGVYDDFRNKFEEIAKSKWEYAREDFYFEQDNIIKALDESGAMSKEAATSWCNRSENEYSLDISTFAKKVREYIEAKSMQTGKKQFVVFLCDEVGQYIGSSGPLMLNLQNIVEGLGIECSGRAWVICTGQEDIETISKNLDRDAFSKIIGRFDTRLKLSSSNVDEVIKKRLLDKTEAAKDSLRLLYEEKNSVIKNLITFEQDKQEMRVYDTVNDFIDIYPFIQYQFKLLQDVFNGIRTHGASGKHLSEGERSLLNAFQEAAIQYANGEVGVLIPFNTFYKTVETFLDHNIRRVILEAKDKADRGSILTDYDVEVLKVLFMIKYTADKFSPNLENITTLMLTHIDQVRLEVKENLRNSLKRLADQKLIIKNGDHYVFLTNEEQDINREISNINIDQSILVEEAGKLIFSTIFGMDRRFRYSPTHDFAYNSYVDGKALGSVKEEIGLDIITPYYLGNTDDAAISLLSGRESKVFAILPSNVDFMEELKESKQIEEFIRRGKNKTFTDTAETIISTKTREGKQRLERCTNLIVEALKKADIYVNGNKLNIKEKSPKERINEAFVDLIDIIYSKLGYIKEAFLTPESLRDVFKQKYKQAAFDGSDNKDPNYLAIEDMLDVITKSSLINITNTMRTLTERYSKAPYAWKEYDIAGIILTLFKEQKIRLELGGETISTHDPNIVDYCIKRDYVDRLVIKIRDNVSQVLISNAKDLSRDMFGCSNLSNDEDGMMKEIKEFIDLELFEKNDSIEKLLANYRNRPYPGKTVLEDGKKSLERIYSIKDIKGFFEALQSERDNLLDYVEDVSDVKKFFSGGQREIFEKSLGTIDIFNASRIYIMDNDTIKLVEEISKITKLPSPYSEIHKLPELRERFNIAYLDILDKECEPIREIVKSDMAYCLADLERRSFKDRFEKQVRDSFDQLLIRLDATNKILDAIGMKEESDRTKIRFINKFIEEEAKIARERAKAANVPDVVTIPVKQTKTISIKTLISGTSQIETKEDIERLLSDLRTKLERQLSEDITIRII